MIGTIPSWSKEDSENLHIRMRHLQKDAHPLSDFMAGLYSERLRKPARCVRIVLIPCVIFAVVNSPHAASNVNAKIAVSRIILFIVDCRCASHAAQQYQTLKIYTSCNPNVSQYDWLDGRN